MVGYRLKTYISRKQPEYRESGGRPLTAVCLRTSEKARLHLVAIGRGESSFINNEEIIVQYRFDISGSRLVVNVTGHYDADVAVNKFSSILSYCRTYSVYEVLIDFRELGGIGFVTSEIMYAYHIAKLYRQFIAEGGEPLRIAYLGPNSYINSWNPGLGVARAGGLNIIATTRLPEAEEWLDCRGKLPN